MRKKLVSEIISCDPISYDDIIFLIILCMIYTTVSIYFIIPFLMIHEFLYDSMQFYCINMTLYWSHDSDIRSIIVRNNIIFLIILCIIYTTVSIYFIIPFLMIHEFLYDSMQFRCINMTLYWSHDSDIRFIIIQHK
jgi:hypothetical protein